jgi:hypothetical protein
MARLEKILRGMLISDRLLVKSVYESTAQAIEADGILDEPAVTTVDDVIQIHKSVKRFTKNGIHTACPALFPAIDEEVTSAMMSAIVASPESPLFGRITHDVRRKVVKCFDRIAWAGLGGDE